MSALSSEARRGDLPSSQQQQQQPPSPLGKQNCSVQCSLKQAKPTPPRHRRTCVCPETQINTNPHMLSTFIWFRSLNRHHTLRPPTNIAMQAASLHVFALSDSLCPQMSFAMRPSHPSNPRPRKPSAPPSGSSPQSKNLILSNL